MKEYKKWVCTFLITTILMLGGLGAITIVVDPYFHYHAPLENLEYPINNERYQNDGIAKNFDYDAMITGTSMVENFKSTEFDQIFGVNSVKLPYPGAYYKEINGAVERAISANPNLRIVIRSLDSRWLCMDKDADAYEGYPEYLYDDFFPNDVNYFLNKSILLNATRDVKAYTERGEKTTTFDEYLNTWNEDFHFGKEQLDKCYERPEKVRTTQQFTELEYRKMQENLTQNVIELAQKNPQVDFYLFYPPHSIYYWDSLNQAGYTEHQLKKEEEAIKILIEYDNIYLFSFTDDFELICDLNNFGDVLHYTGDVNSWILECMYSGEHRLTKENYEEYCDKVYNFYTTYDYDALFAE